MSPTDERLRLESEADALISLGRHEQALSVLAQATALDPDAARPHMQRARCLIGLKRYDEAAGAAGSAISRAPESSLAHRLLALTQLHTGKERGAKKSALRAVGLDPDEAYNYLVLAEALQATRDEAGALAAARHAIELAPQNAPIHDLEGRLLLAHEDLKGAEAAFRRALALDPENELILNNLSIVLARRGRREEAVAGLEAASRIDPADSFVRGNVLRIARSRTALMRGLGIALAFFGVLTIAFAFTSDEDLASLLVFGAVMIVVGALLFEWGVRRSSAGLTGPTADLIRDDHHARRFKPWRWDWSWITRLRPWWWLVLQRIPPPIALALNIAAGIAAPLILLGVPFSAWRAWLWYRRVRPGAGSWRAPG